MKGQITVYIIIGILALLFTGVGIYVVNKTITKPQAVTPQSILSNIVMDCLQRTAKDGLFLIGTQGGYVDLSKQGIRTNPQPAEGDALFIAPEQQVAYWWYLKSPNECATCDLSSRQMPALEKIAHEIEDYVTKHLADCTRNFDALAGQGMHVSAENITVRTEFTKDNVRFHLDWPITVTQGMTETKLNAFETALDIPFKQMYEVARDITLEEKNNATLERMLLHMIGLYSDVTPAKLPPFSAVTHDNMIVSWNKNIVEQYVAFVLQSAVPLIKYGTPAQAKEGGFEEAALGALHFGTKTPFAVKFNFLGWPVYFDITPEQKNILSPEVVRTRFPNNVAPPFQTNTYEFFYDLSVPLLVEVRDDKANKGDGYSLFFALEANIRDNKELRAFHTGEGTYGLYDTKRQEITAAKKQIQYNESLFCAEEQKLSGTIKINVLDGRNNTPVPETALSYGCGNIRTCTLMTTNQRGVLKTKLPICYNGHLRAEKEGYYPAVNLYTTEFEKRDEVNVTMQPLREVQVSVKKYHTNGTALTLGPRSLETTEQAIIILNRITERIEEPFQTQVQVQGSATVTVSLIPGNYEIRAMLIDKRGFVLPAKCMQVCESYDKEGKCAAFKQLPEKSQNVKPAMLGGAILNNNTGLLEITDYTLDNRGINTIEFFVVKTQTPNCIAKENCILPNCVGIDEIGRTEEYSKRFIDEIKPRFLRR